MSDFHPNGHAPWRTHSVMVANDPRPVEAEYRLRNKNNLELWNIELIEGEYWWRRPTDDFRTKVLSSAKGMEIMEGLDHESEAFVLLWCSK